MSKSKKTIKRFMFILLFVIFLPVVLIYIIVKSIAKKSRYNTWRKSGLTGRRLVLSAGINELDNLEDFELKEYIKYLFFYDGYLVKDTPISKNGAHFFLNNGNDKALLKIANLSKKSLKMQLEYLNFEKTKHGINYGVIVTTKEVDSSIIEISKASNVQFIPRSLLSQMITRVQKRLKLDEGYVTTQGDISISELIDEMYPNKI